MNNTDSLLQSDASWKKKQEKHVRSRDRNILSVRQGTDQKAYLNQEWPTGLEHEVELYQDRCAVSTVDQDERDIVLP